MKPAISKISSKVVNLFADAPERVPVKTATPFNWEFPTGSEAEAAMEWASTCGGFISRYSVSRSHEMPNCWVFEIRFLSEQNCDKFCKGFNHV